MGMVLYLLVNNWRLLDCEAVNHNGTEILAIYGDIEEGKEAIKKLVEVKGNQLKADGYSSVNVYIHEHGIDLIYVENGVTTIETYCLLKMILNEDYDYFEDNQPQSEILFPHCRPSEPFKRR